jgi:hypothetical protein
MAHEIVRGPPDPGNIPAMRNRTTMAVAVALTSVAMTLAACGSSAPTGDQTTSFVGTWAFSSGMLTPTCMSPIPQLPPFSLKGLTVAFTKVDDSTFSLTAGTAGCTVLFGASGQTATARPMQTCMLDLGPPLGPEAVAIKSWTLTASGDQIENTISGAIAVCTADGSGVLVRATAPAADAGAD